MAQPEPSTRGIRTFFARRRRRFGIPRLLSWTLAAVLPLCSAWAATQYLYDDLGRLVLVAAADGSATVYEHDANGNIVEITQWGATGPVIGTFTPAYGHVGTTVTILGTNFSATPSLNTVTIGGSAATVSAATTTSLTSAIPTNAVTGPITVTVGGVTATSATNIIVQRPAITSFSPAMVAPGGSVTVTGANLNLVPGGTTLKVGNTSVTVTSLSNTQAVFTAPSGGVGRVIVNTSYGTATSATNLTVIPSAIGLANVLDHSTIAAGGSSASLSINQASKYAVFDFDAVAGQYLSIQLGSLTTTPANAYVGYTVYSSTGTSLATGSVQSAAMSIHLPPIPATGAYFVAFGSGSSSSVSLAATLEVNQALSRTGAATSSSTSGVRQSKRFVLDATAGDDVGLAISSLTLTPSSPNYLGVQVNRPDGAWITNFWGYASGNPASAENFMNLPQTGTYTVIVGPQGAQTMSFNLTLSEDVTGSLTAGTPMTVNLSRLGQVGLPTFTATAGQTVAVHAGSISTTPSGKSVTMNVYNASGTNVGSTAGTSQAVVNLKNLAAGTYSVRLVPQDGATASMQLTLANGMTGSVQTNGTTQSFSSNVPGQNGYFTFSATAGDDFGLALTNFSLSGAPNGMRIWVQQPGGSWVAYLDCNTTATPGCSASLLNLPVTGTYTLFLEAAGMYTMSGTLRLTQDITGTLTAGSPTSLNLSTPGQLALLGFTATAGQTFALHMGSISTTPSGKTVAMTVYNGSGAYVTSTSSTSQAVLNLTNLAAGTYSVLVAPADASTGSMQVTLANGTTGSLPTNGTGQSFSSSVAGQNGYFTFSATAGDDLGLALTNLSLSPATPNWVRIWVLRPGGSWVAYFDCSTTPTPGCSANLLNLPATGTYTVLLEAEGMYTMGGTLTLTQDVTGTLTVGSPTSLSLSAPGQLALLTFTATSGQNVAVSMSSIATTPSGKSVQLFVYNPSGSQIGYATNTSSATINLTNLAAGTYSVLVVPPDAATATAQVQIQ